MSSDATKVKADASMADENVVGTTGVVATTSTPATTTVIPTNPTDIRCHWSAPSGTIIDSYETINVEYLKCILARWHHPHVVAIITKSAAEGYVQSNTAGMLAYYRTLLPRVTGGIAHVRYEQKESKGRHFAITPNLQMMVRCVRQTITNEHVVDVDMVNCHPTVLAQFCKMNNIVCDRLMEYVADRKRVMEGLNIYDPKLYILYAINGAKVKNSKAVLTEWMVDFQREIRDIIDQIYALISHIYPTGNKTYNQAGSVVNRMMCDIENMILYHAVGFLNSRGFMVQTLSFDGCTVTRQPGIHDKLHAVFPDLEAYVHEKTNYRIKFVIKPMEEVMDMEAIAKLPADMDGLLDRTLADDALLAQYVQQAQASGFELADDDDIATAVKATGAVVDQTAIGALDALQEHDIL